MVADLVVSKKDVIDRIIEKLTSELSALIQAAKASHEAATHEESRAEDAHDTRGLEASYLAGAQAARASEIQKLISVFRQMPIRPFHAGESIEIGALIELELSGKRSLHLFAPLGGGISIQLELEDRASRTVGVITPQAPLGEALLGRKAGDEIELEAQGRNREYSVIKVF